MPKVIITPRSYGMYDPDIYDLWKKKGFTVIREEGPLTEDKLIELLGDAEALLVGTDLISERVLDLAPYLKVISKYGVGTDNIPIQYAEKKGVLVKNTPGVNTEAVADYTFGLILSVTRNIPQSNIKVLKGQWKKSVGTELSGKTLGILGFGAIGRAVAKRAQGFDMNLLAFDLFPNYDLADEYKVTFADFDRVLQESDILSIHLPLTPETRNLIDETEFKKMKNTSFIINTARGGILNEEALYYVLKNNVIQGAALDVFSDEPLINSPFYGLENIVLTSHNASSSIEAVSRMTRESTNNVINFFQSLQRSKS